MELPRIVEMLALVQEHRNQIAHVAKRGIYTLGRSNEFVKGLRESGWLAEFCLRYSHLRESIEQGISVMMVMLPCR